MYASVPGDCSVPQQSQDRVEHGQSDCGASTTLFAVDSVRLAVDEGHGCDYDGIGDDCRRERMVWHKSLSLNTILTSNGLPARYPVRAMEAGHERCCRLTLPYLS